LTSTSEPPGSLASETTVASKLLRKHVDFFLFFLNDFLCLFWRLQKGKMRKRAAKNCFAALGL
jgi:hypothetical protein